MDWALGVPLALLVAYLIVRCEVSHDRREMDALGLTALFTAPLLLVYTLTLFVRGRTLLGRLSRTATLYATIPLLVLAVWGFLCALGMIVAADL